MTIKTENIQLNKEKVSVRKEKNPIKKGNDSITKETIPVTKHTASFDREENTSMNVNGNWEIWMQRQHNLLVHCLQPHFHQASNQFHSWRNHELFNNF